MPVANGILHETFHNFYHEHVFPSRIYIITINFQRKATYVQAQFSQHKLILTQIVIKLGCSEKNFTMLRFC